MAVLGIAELMLNGLLRDVSLLSVGKSTRLANSGGAKLADLIEEYRRFVEDLAERHMDDPDFASQIMTLRGRASSLIRRYEKVAALSAQDPSIGGLEARIDAVSFARRMAAVPRGDRSLFDWGHWAQRAYGMDVSASGGRKSAQPCCAQDWVRHLLGQAPERPFVELALRCLSQKVPVATDLGVALTPGRVMQAVMDGARTATFRARRVAANPKSLPRPGELATLLTLVPSGQSQIVAPHLPFLPEACATIRDGLPKLLDAVDAYNRAVGDCGVALYSREGDLQRGWSPFEIEQIAMMPRRTGEMLQPFRDDTTIHAASAAAGARVVAALFAPDATVEIAAGADRPAVPVREVTEALLAAVRMAHSVEGRFYPYEVEADIRQGQRTAQEILEGLSNDSQGNGRHPRDRRTADNKKIA
ncbi:hypothetical protein [Pseudoprimorskyibacter insulae]|nr:hypothetical protein [Pseudoprimorskyibacter insulae]